MALPLAACGGGSSGDDSEGATATTAAAAGGGEATTTVGTTFTGEGSDAFCRQFRAYADSSRRLAEGGNLDVRTIYSEAARAVSESVAIAPPEIRRDVEVVADAFVALVRELEAVNYEIRRVPSAVVLRFMSEELTTATERVEAYSRSVCRLGN
ncbi:MAG: hypothetical protein ACLGI2_06135 [Acidimicrobiia bacterium]